MTGPVTRKRDLLSDPWTGTVVQKEKRIGDPDSSFRTIKSQFVTPPVKGTQVTVSEGHPFHSRDKRVLDDIGGDFFTQRKYVASDVTNREFKYVEPFSGSYHREYQYTGPLLPVDPSTVSFPPALSSSNSDLDKLGATAVARCKPTNSVADVSTFLGELLKDGIPKALGSTVWQDRTLTAKNASSEFLNSEFGWKPLLNEVLSFQNVVRHGSTVLAQYERDAGKVVRRRYNFPEISEKTESIHGGGRIYFRPYFSDIESGSLGTVVRVREKTQRQWFSGAFTYYLPRGYDSRKALDRYALYAQQVLGASLTPEVLWNLAPWSWAIDWVSNTGDVLSNVSSYIQDGLILRYGYMMEHTIVKDTYTFAGTSFKEKAASIKPNDLVLVTETKIRRRANPFGFGVTWNGLSSLQAAILAAIGITKK